MPNGWLSTDCDGETVIARLASIVDESTKATLLNVQGDANLIARGITTLAQLRYAVEQRVSWCLDHDPNHEVTGGVPFILDEVAHAQHVKDAFDAVDTTPANHDWGTCLDELEHGGDTGSDGPTTISRVPLSLALNIAADDVRDGERMARIMEIIEAFSRGRPHLPG